MHAVALAQELGVKKVVIPRAASVFSAWGMMMSDLRRDYFVTRLIESDGVTASSASKPLSPKPRRSARRSSPAEGVGRPTGHASSAFVKCRYQNQEHTVEVRSPAL